MIKLNVDKKIFLDKLLSIYTEEVEVIHAIGAVWKQLKDKAQDQCAEDFDKALIARETLLEEMIRLKNEEIKCDEYDFLLHSVDQALLKNHAIAKELYGMDVKSFLNIKQPKGLPGPK